MSSQRILPVATLGTYFKSGSPCSGLHRSQMRGLFYRVKGNRELTGFQQVNHPLHPGRAEARLSTPATARQYVAEIYGARKDNLFRLFDMRPETTLLVPIPSSKTTRDNMTSWASLELAQALALQGLGEVRVCAVFKVPHKSRSEGGESKPAHELASLLDIVEAVTPLHNVLYVDDLLTWGDHFAAVDACIGSPEKRAGLTVACTDGADVPDCLSVRVRRVVYDASSVPWDVAVDDGQ